VRSRAAQQSINQVLSDAGRIVRRSRSDGKLGNYPTTHPATVPAKPPRSSSLPAGEISEDDVKHSVEEWLTASGWQVVVKWGKTQGIDVEAQKGDQRWIIEAKRCGSLDAMRVNYFVAMLGQLLQRINDSRARYSIALPDLKQFRALWQRLPDLAKSRTTISALFVDSSGRVQEIKGGLTGTGTDGAA
jgi:hypothetical protein